MKDQRNIPPILGGQGRSSQSISDSVWWFGCLFTMGAILALVLAVWG